MSRLYADTHPKMEALEMVWQLNDAVHTLALSGLQTRYPSDPAEKIRRRMADLLLGPDLAARVYGPLETTENVS